MYDTFHWVSKLESEPQESFATETHVYGELLGDSHPISASGKEPVVISVEYGRVGCLLLAAGLIKDIDEVSGMDESKKQMIQKYSQEPISPKAIEEMQTDSYMPRSLLLDFMEATHMDSPFMMYEVRGWKD